MLSRMQMGIMLEEEKTGEAYPGLNLAINSVLRQKRENGWPFVFSQHRSEEDQRDHVTPEDQLACGGEGVLPASARASFSVQSSFLHESLILTAASCLLTLLALNDTTSINKTNQNKTKHFLRVIVQACEETNVLWRAKISASLRKQERLVSACL